MTDATTPPATDAVRPAGAASGDRSGGAGSVAAAAPTTTAAVDASASGRRYHHGNLPDTLRAATADLLAERGTSGFSLREVARRAGVSHAAPAHHFGDAGGLITSVATEGFRTLADALEAAAATATDARSRAQACARAYIRTALEHPGHFAVMMQGDMVDDTDPEFLDASVRAYGALQDMVRTVRDELNPHLDVDVGSTFCWATVHGLVVLAPGLEQVASKVEADHTPLDELIDQVTTLMLDGLAAR